MRLSNQSNFRTRPCWLLCFDRLCWV